MHRFPLILLLVIFKWSCISIAVAEDSLELDTYNSPLTRNFTQALETYKNVLHQSNLTEILNVTDIPILFNEYNATLPTNFLETWNTIVSQFNLTEILELYSHGNDTVVTFTSNEEPKSTSDEGNNENLPRKPRTLSLLLILDLILAQVVANMQGQNPTQPNAI